jgi:GyrI-like small molecule binding domain
VTEAEWAQFLDQARHLLSDAATATDAVVVGPFGACYPPLLDDDVQEVLAFVPVATAPLLQAATQSAGIAIGELPATDVAVIDHRGDYDDLEDTYRDLGSWVASHGEPAELPVRELYLLGPGDTDDPNEYRTEICWPLRTRASSEQET